jgi:hypothetical protein
MIERRSRSSVVEWVGRVTGGWRADGSSERTESGRRVHTRGTGARLANPRLKVLRIRYHAHVTRSRRLPSTARPASVAEHVQLDLSVLPQPDDSTCGPTCLHAVYRYWGHEVPLSRLVSEVTPLPGGGTLAVSLACHALRAGFRSEIFTYDLRIFDPTWFTSGVDLAERLRAQREAKRKPKLLHATAAYLEYLELGGVIRYTELQAGLIRRYVASGVPILTGLSATYLYGCSRERANRYDDVRGEPVGHFVVLSGYDRSSRKVMVADPLLDNPLFGSHYYAVRMDRLIAAILLGIVTYDANLLVLTPADRPD